MDIPLYGIWQTSFTHSTDAVHPYRDLEAAAWLSSPDGDERQIPLFWDGGRTWRLRFSPNQAGTWHWRTESTDPGLDGHSGTFEVVPAGRRGSIQPMAGYPHHFQRQDGSPFWWLGETAWSYYLDNAEEGYDRAGAEHHVTVRAAQGFNVFHSMLLSELGWGNAGGAPFLDLAGEQINPAYWQEVDRRLAYLHERGVVGGLVLAWARKRREEGEPLAWDHFADQEARLRYARYVAARYSAYDIYFVVAGEWNASCRWRDSDIVRQEYIAIGDALRAADPHGRMIGIHPGTGGVYGVGEFNDYSEWMSFGDYQQNYVALHAAILAAHQWAKPVVNAEYAYYLRRQEGRIVKPNSQDVEVIRHATWDIAMAGGYVVSGFGSTYLGGARHDGPFDVDAPQNDDWEAQIQHVPAFFQSTAWWRLVPHDALLRADVPHSGERQVDSQPAPPSTVYWCLSEPGAQYVVYVRGMETPLYLALNAPATTYRARRFDPRTGAWTDLGTYVGITDLVDAPPDGRDWVLLLEAVPSPPHAGCS